MSCWDSEQSELCPIADARKFSLSALRTHPRPSHPGIEANIPIKDAVALQKPRNQKKNEHGSGTPAEHLNRQSRDERWSGETRFPFAKDQAANQTNSGCEEQQLKRSVDPFVEYDCGIEESCIKHAVQREDAEHQGERLRDFGHGGTSREFYCKPCVGAS
jgi:hypothetical protein